MTREHLTTIEDYEAKRGRRERNLAPTSATLRRGRGASTQGEALAQTTAHPLGYIEDLFTAFDDVAARISSAAVDTFETNSSLRLWLFIPP
jgi:hypothetical protein